MHGDELSTALSAWAAGVTLVTIADDRDDIGTTVSAFLPVSLDPPLVAVSLIAGSYPAEVLSRPASSGGTTPRTPRGGPDGPAIVSGPPSSGGTTPRTPRGGPDGPAIVSGPPSSGGTTPRTPRGGPDGSAIVSGPRLPAARFAVTLLSSEQKMVAGQFAAAGRPSARLILDAAPHQRGPASGALIPTGGLAALECSVARRVPAGDHLLVISAVENVVYVAESGDPLVRFRGRYPAL